MRNAVAALVMALALPSAWGTTYDYVGMPYSTQMGYLLNFTPPCTAGSCASYTPVMQVTGHLTTAAPLPPGLVSLDITSLVTAFSFSDGVHTFSSTDAQLIKAKPFITNTDAAGNITSLSAVVGHWQSPVVPHAQGSRLDYVEIGGYNAGLGIHYDQGETNN